MDESQVNDRKAVYIDHISGMYRRERTIGVIGCLVGVLLLFWSRFRGDAPHWAMIPALVIIAAAWLLFAYVILRRTAWVRAHPFNPDAPQPHG
jgi:hypothetical protein